jgi:hypothetical protein
MDHSNEDLISLGHCGDSALTDSWVQSMVGVRMKMLRLTDETHDVLLDDGQLWAVPKGSVT